MSLVTVAPPPAWGPRPPPCLVPNVFGSVPAPAMHEMMQSIVGQASRFSMPPALLPFGPLPGQHPCAPQFRPMERPPLCPSSMAMPMPGSVKIPSAPKSIPPLQIPRMQSTGGSFMTSPRIPHEPQSARRGNSNLEIDELYCEEDVPCDPTAEEIKVQLLAKMHLPPTAQVETLRGGIGSCNVGMWILRSGAQNFVLKLVRTGAGSLPGQGSQADKFARLSREHPGIGSDPAVAFPCKIFNVVSSAGKSHDLVVMRQVPGQRMSDVIMSKLHGRQVQDLMRILEQFGSFLADFHRRYNGMQHGDLTPSNVFYDQASGRFALVDVADLAPRNPVIQSDTERFSSSLRLLSTFYGPQLAVDGKARFEAGYNARRGF